jgi:hypothetical protein
MADNDELERAVAEAVADVRRRMDPRLEELRKGLNAQQLAKFNENVEAFRMDALLQSELLARKNAQRNEDSLQWVASIPDLAPEDREETVRAWKEFNEDSDRRVREFLDDLLQIFMNSAEKLREHLKNKS